MRFDNVVFIICASLSSQGHPTTGPSTDQPTACTMSVSLRFVYLPLCSRLLALPIVAGEAAHGAVTNGAPPGVPVS
ncbi:MAG: hypothetical protein JNK55_12530 [Rubrivivax sp.]|nr:hypothetical protein [Rubrivivax sp.]